LEEVGTEYEFQKSDSGTPLSLHQTSNAAWLIVKFGILVISRICTSHVEKQNHTLRMHCRRLTRLTNPFSKKLENFKEAVALHYAYYNFVKVHQTIRCTPAMEAGVTNSIWTVSDLVGMIEA